MLFYCRACNALLSPGAGICPVCGTVFAQSVPENVESSATARSRVALWPPPRRTRWQKSLAQVRRIGTRIKPQYTAAAALAALVAICAVVVWDIAHPRPATALDVPGIFGATDASFLTRVKTSSAAVPPQGDSADSDHDLGGTSPIVTTSLHRRRPVAAASSASGAAPIVDTVPDDPVARGAALLLSPDQTARLQQEMARLAKERNMPALGQALTPMKGVSAETEVKAAAPGTEPPALTEVIHQMQRTYEDAGRRYVKFHENEIDPEYVQKNAGEVAVMQERVNQAISLGSRVPEAGKLEWRRGIVAMVVWKLEMSDTVDAVRAVSNST